MIGTRGYTVFGWVVKQFARRAAKKKIRQNRMKLAAAGVVALVLVGGVLAARSGSDS
jgi:Na+/H+ antiporter NhaB